MQSALLICNRVGSKARTRPFLKLDWAVSSETVHQGFSPNV